VKNQGGKTMLPWDNKASSYQAHLQGIIDDARMYVEGALKTKDQAPPM